MGPLDGGMVLIGKKFSQYLNSQGDPLCIRVTTTVPIASYTPARGTVVFMHSGKERNQSQNLDVYPI
jgi:hypothetical protein